VARAYALPGLGARTTIRLARFGVEAGLLGAAMLAAHELDLSMHHPSNVEVPES
jgi:hypothetical protein